MFRQNCSLAIFQCLSIFLVVSSLLHHRNLSLIIISLHNHCFAYNRSIKLCYRPISLSIQLVFLVLHLCFQNGYLSYQNREGGGVAQWLGRRISDQGVPGSNPGRCTFRCGLEQVTFTLLSTGWTQEAVDGRPTWTDCDEAGDYIVPNVLSPRDLVFRPDNKDETVPHTPE